MKGKAKCLVTGGAGFIGSHLVELLVGQGHEVIVLDDLSTGRRSNLQATGEVQFVQGDVADASAYDAVGDVDWVFHLAARADIVPSIENPEEYHRTNVDGTFQCLQYARRVGAKRFVYAASSSCYGLPDTFPTSEAAPIRPMYPYALTKRLGEELVLHWAQTYGLPCVSLRLFNVFGPRARTTGTYGAVFGVFLAQKLAGKPLTVVGDGGQTRDFTFVTDVARAFYMAAASDLRGEALNVGSGGTYSVNHLVSLMDAPAIHIPKRPGEPDSTFADTTRIQERLGWQPEVSFEQGVRILLDDIDAWRDAPVWDRKSIEQATRSWFKYLGEA